jgi:hypothetical protein
MKFKLILLIAVATLGLSAATVAQVPNYVPTNGLVGWWPFNGNANDESGNGNNGLVNGPSLTSDRFGNAGKAYSFSGQNGVDIQVPASPSLQPTAALSLSIWVRVQNSSGWQNFVCKRYQYTTDPFNSYIIGEYSADGNQYNPNSNERYFGGALTSNSLSSVGAIDGQNRSLNEWRNYTLTYNGQKIRLYHNGSIVSENDGSGPIQYSNLPLFFGTTSLDNQNFIGDLDDIALYNRALSQQEITALYQGGNTSNSCSVLPANLQQGLKGYWPFCGNANDESGNDCNGIVNGALLTNDRFGMPNHAFQFSGNSRIILNDNSGALNLRTDLTISLWAKMEFPNSGYQAFVWRGDSQGEHDPYTMGCEFNNVIFRRDVSDGSQINKTEAPLNNYNPNDWIYLTLTFSSSTGKTKFYFNGNSVLEVLKPNSINYETINMITQFGSVENFSSFNGLLDDIAIWNRALSAEEISQLYEVQSCGTPLLVSLSGSPIITSSTGSSIDIQATANSDSTRWQWQAEAAGMSWNDLSKNARYQATDSSRLRVTSLNVANHLQKFRVIGKKGGCRDTSGTVVLQLSDTCITSVIDTNFVTITDTSFVTVTDTNLITITDTNFVTITDTSFITVFDTNLVTVTDTLIINATITGLNPPSNQNTLKVFPNPANTHITIDYGIFSSMSGYTLKIVNALGQTVFISPINQQTSYINLSTWTGSGIYYVQLINPQNNTIENRKIVIQ